MKPMKCYRLRVRWIGAAAVALTILCAEARTVVLDASVADRMAAIHEEAPRLSWAAYRPSAGLFEMTLLDLTPESRFLVRFDLSVIPPRQRVVHAELSVPVTEFTGSDPRLFVWRTVADWGPGVCHAFRRTWPDALPWSVPGARGAGADRALNPSAAVRLTEAGVLKMNVTEDVALWYLKAAPDQGWMLGTEDPGVRIRLPSPAWDAAAQWRLQITYEPE